MFGPQKSSLLLSSILRVPFTLVAPIVCVLPPSSIMPLVVSWCQTLRVLWPLCGFTLKCTSYHITGGSTQTIGATNVKGTLNIDDNNKDDFCGPNMKIFYSDRCCSHFTRVQYLAMFAFGITLVSFLIAIFNRKAQNKTAQNFELLFVLASFAWGWQLFFM